MPTITLQTEAGATVRFEDRVFAQGGMKDVYMGADRSYVVAFFREPLSCQGKDRLRSIVGAYREGIFGRGGGDYWHDVFCWPTDIVEYDGCTGIVVPTYKSHYFFAHGSINNDVLGIKGSEKQGKWFASASNRKKFLPKEEKGTWLTHLQVCLRISRAVRRLHAAGLAHSDLSYKNILIDPTSGQACIIDIDGLVVPGKYPPDVVGTPDFIAPEVIATQHLDRADPNRKLPSTLTDRHALAVLIYMYLLYRHPLRGGKMHDRDTVRDDELAMGSQALFIEHPTDRSNRVNRRELTDALLPWGDPDRVPYTIAGPLLARLFEQAFIDGLHDPQQRPAPSEWENALVRTIDMIQPCHDAGCEMGWYVFDNTTAPRCPLCGTPFRGTLPVLNLYSKRDRESFRPDNHRLMVWNGQSLFPWHVNRMISPNEHLKPEQRRRVGYFQNHQGDWYLVNENMPQMQDVASRTDIPISGHVKLTDGAQFLLSREDGGRLIQVQLVNG